MPTDLSHVFFLNDGSPLEDRELWGYSDPGWYHLDETGTQLYGPHPDRESAQVAEAAYDAELRAGKFTKGKQLIYPVPRGLRGVGRMKTRCRCPQCNGKPSFERYTLLPCGCHGLIVECTCPVRDKHCKTCGRVFVQHGQKWFEVVDPHWKGKRR